MLFTYDKEQGYNGKYCKCVQEMGDFGQIDGGIYGKELQKF